MGDPAAAAFYLACAAAICERYNGLQVSIAKQLKKILDLADSQRLGFLAHVSS